MEIKILCENCEKDEGTYEVPDEAGEALAKGVYVCSDCVAKEEMLEDVAPGEALNLIDVIIRLNRDFCIRPHKSSHYRNRGEKGRVDAELRLFNGDPQLIFFYGKRRYTFDINPRKAPSTYPALKGICGYRGIAEIRGAVAPYFNKDDLDAREAVLRRRGV